MLTVPLLLGTYAPSTSAIEAIKFETKGANVALAEPELYTGETKQLLQTKKAASGKISVPALYDIQQKSVATCQRDSC